MKARRRICCRAALLATLFLGGSAYGRDTAGPEAPRRPERDASAVRPPHAAPPASDAAAPVAGSAPMNSLAPADERTPGATGGPSPEDAERAKQLYASGAEAFAAQRNADAIRYFRRAAELVPSAKLTYNIGLAYEEMGDSGRALAEYRSYLTQEREADSARLEDVRARIAKLERRLAETGVQQLLVTSDPPGATVRIGGRALGVTPWTGELAPGHHQVALELAGHTPRHADVTLSAERSTELALALAPAPPEVASDPNEPGGSRWSPLAWTFLGVGAGSLAAGVAFELSRAGSSRDADRASDPVDAAEARGAADAKQTASVLLLGAGAGLSIAGAVLLILDRSEPSPPRARAALDAACTPEFCGVLTRGRF
jgi:tetratricopeptide (TPR) repeat protein